MALTRFTSAQDRTTGGFAAAIAELRSGQKRSHWIWYVFPQLAGLGQSTFAREYAMRDLDEAREYFAHPVLGARLLEATDAVAEYLRKNVPLESLMGSQIDALKLVSSLTLFEAVARERASDDAAAARFADLASAVLDQAARQGYPRCEFTRRHLS
jgi:uncharacterized protein (DUF1810 family)